MGRVFMEPFDDPFAAINRELDACPLREAADAIVVDFHCEATSEKQGMGFFCDGRASLVVGTHTHVPTADHQILPGGTAYMTDAGMTGDYDSIIGMQKEEPLRRFTPAFPRAGSNRRLGRGDAERRRGRDRRCDRPGAADRAGAGRRQAGAADRNGECVDRRASR
jgi:calcineurin-like phosphoesterase